MSCRVRAKVQNAVDAAKGGLGRRSRYPAAPGTKGNEAVPTATFENVRGLRSRLAAVVGAVVGILVSPPFLRTPPPVRVLWLLPKAAPALLRHVQRATSN